MRRTRRLALSSVGVAALTLGLLLGGCGVSATPLAGQIATASAATATADATISQATMAAEASTATAVAVNSAAFPTPTFPPPDLATLEAPGCDPLSLGPVTPKHTAVDGLSVSIPQRWTMLDYPSEVMPNNAPNAPYKVPLTASEAQIGSFHPNPAVNPSLSTGYAIQVCNQTSVAHTITSIRVNITSFTPSSGPVTVWHLCQDGPYDAATRQTTGGCGGSVGGVDWLAATLPHDSAGASALAVANTKVGSGGPNLPVILGPNKSIVFLIAVDGLTSQGTYTLSFSVGVDGATPATLAPSDGAFLIAPAAKVWTGTACQTPAMQAQIPASTQDVYYVCPPAS